MLSRTAYQRWFYAAAIYNFIWGAAIILDPVTPFKLFGAEPPNYPSLFQCIGMMVMVFGYGYWLIARQPERFAHYAWIGLLGKVFGPIGFVFAASRGELPWTFGWTILTNDLIWWPVFIMFCLKYAPKPWSVPSEPTGSELTPGAAIMDKS